MSAEELAHASPLSLPEHAWGRRGPSRGARSPALAPIRGFVSAFLLLDGGLRLLGDLSFLWKVQWFHGIHPLFPLLALPEQVLTVALAIALLRGSPARVRGLLAALLFSAGVSSASMLLNSGALASPRWFAAGSILVWIVLGIGVWRATEWGRRGCTIVGPAMCGYYLTTGFASASRIWRDHPDSLSAVLWIFFVTFSLIFVVTPYLLLAMYGLLPSTRKQFAEARAVADRRS